MRQYGDGPETLVLAHGFGWNQDAWARYIDVFTPHFRVVTYDLACAYSADPAFFDIVRHRQIDGYIQDLFNILDHLAVTTCTFIGHSVSGMIGLLASMRDTARFKKIVALGSSPCYLERDGYQGGFSEGQLRDILTTIADDYRAWAQGYAPIVVDRPLEDQVTSTFLDCLLAMRKDVTLAMAQMILLADYRAEMARVAVPTVLLQSQSDPAVPLSAATYLRDNIRGSVLEIIDATGHMPHLTAFPLVEAALRRHLGLDNPGGQTAAG